jgi:hypothetical protein
MSDYDRPTPRRATSKKERELSRIKERFGFFTEGFPSSGFEEDAIIERVNDAFDDLIELVRHPAPKD